MVKVIKGDVPVQVVKACASSSNS